MGHIEVQQERVERLGRQVNAWVTTVQAQSLHAHEHIEELKHEHATMHAQSEQLEEELKTRCAKTEAELQATVERCEEAIRSKQAELGAQTNEVESKLKDLLVAQQQQQLDQHKNLQEQQERRFEELRVETNNFNQEQLTHRLKQVIECLTKRLEERCKQSEKIRGVGRSETMPSGPRPQRHKSLRQLRWLHGCARMPKALDRAINNAATSSSNDSNLHLNPEEAAESAGGVADKLDVINEAGETGEKNTDELVVELITKISDAIISRLEAQERNQQELERHLEIKLKFMQNTINFLSRMQSVIL